MLAQKGEHLARDSGVYDTTKSNQRTRRHLGPMPCCTPAIPYKSECCVARFLCPMTGVWANRWVKRGWGWHWELALNRIVICQQIFYLWIERSLIKSLGSLTLCRHVSQFSSTQVRLEKIIWPTQFGCSVHIILLTLYDRTFMYKSW